MTKIIENRLDGEMRIIGIEGDLNSVSIPLLREEIQSSLREQSSNLALDLTAIDFVDSSGISMLISLHKKLHDSGHKLVLVKMPAMLRGALEVTHLLSMFEVVDSIDELK